jgi:hypothetical protein
LCPPWDSILAPGALTFCLFYRSGNRRDSVLIHLQNPSAAQEARSDQDWIGSRASEGCGKFAASHRGQNGPGPHIGNSEDTHCNGPNAASPLDRCKPLDGAYIRGFHGRR